MCAENSLTKLLIVQAYKERKKRKKKAYKYRKSKDVQSKIAYTSKININTKN